MGKEYQNRDRVRQIKPLLIISFTPNQKTNLLQ